MRLGLSVDRFRPPAGPASWGAALGDLARRAEGAGLASLWINDHFLQIPLFGEATDPVLEAYTTLGYLAGCTSTLELGTLTTGATYRHPGLLLKVVTTLDVLSGGRAWLGIGATWFEREHDAYGMPFVPVAERLERLEEVVRLARQIFSGDPAPFAGRHYQLAEPHCSPAALRSPPLLIGGVHERRVLSLVARYGDACNLFESGGAEALRFKLRYLREQCEAAGRPYAALRKTTFGELRLTEGGDGERLSVAAAVDRFAALAEEGIGLAIVSLTDVAVPGAVELLGEVAARLDALPSGEPRYEAGTTPREPVLAGTASAAGAAPVGTTSPAGAARRSSKGEP